MPDFLLLPFRADLFLSSRQTEPDLYGAALEPNDALLDAAETYSSDEGSVPIGDFILCALETKAIDEDLTREEQRVSELLNAISYVRSGRLKEAFVGPCGYLLASETVELAALLDRVSLDGESAAVDSLGACARGLGQQNLGLLVAFMP